MYPQQRNLLECVYEAYETRVIPLDSVSGKNVANFNPDFAMMAPRHTEHTKLYSMTGHGNTILSNRASYSRVGIHVLYKKKLSRKTRGKNIVMCRI